MSSDQKAQQQAQLEQQRQKAQLEQQRQMFEHQQAMMRETSQSLQNMVNTGAALAAGAGERSNSWQPLIYTPPQSSSAPYLISLVAVLTAVVVVVAILSKGQGPV